MGGKLIFMTHYPTRAVKSSCAAGEMLGDNFETMQVEIIHASTDIKLEIDVRGRLDRATQFSIEFAARTLQPERNVRSDYQSKRISMGSIARWKNGELFIRQFRILRLIAVR